MTDFLMAEAGIRQLHSRYTDAVWRKDADAFGDCFAEDAEWRVGGKTMVGRDNCVEFMRGCFPIFRRIFMTLRPPILEVGNGEATGRSYVTEQSVFADGRPFFVIGIYYERFVQEGDRWRFKWRLFQTQYSGSPDMTEPFMDVQDFGPPPAMPPLDAQTFSRSGVSDTAAGA